VIGTLNAMCKSIQLMDTEHEQGFSPNRQRVFGLIVSVMRDFSVLVNLAFIPERTDHPIVNIIVLQRKDLEGILAGRTNLNR